ncbi:MAG: hypothetical protein ACU83V_11385 [Gammaproteobacteria bacterium]
MLREESRIISGRGSGFVGGYLMAALNVRTVIDSPSAEGML